MKQKKSVITGQYNFEDLHCYKNFPVFMGCTKQNISSDIHYDMKFEICRDSGIIQINDLPPIEEIYKFSHHDAVGDAWAKHNTGFCNFISIFGNPGKVLELGGGNGRIAQEFTNNYHCDEWHIIDPQPIFSGNEKIKIRKSWFDKTFVLYFIPSTIIHSCVFEHALDPFDFLQRTYNLLPAGGKSYISIPDLKLWLKQGFVNSLNFEHNIFVSDEITEYFINKVGFNIKEKHYYSGGWIWYALEKNSDQRISSKHINFYEEYKSIFMDFVRFNDEKVKVLNDKINCFNGEVYLFGAHIFSSFLLNTGLKDEKIKGILDHSELKNEQRLYGTKFNSEYPDVIKNKKNIAVILNVAQHKNTIIEKLLTLNPNITLIE